MPTSAGTVQHSALKRIALSRGTRITAATVAVGLAAGAIVTSGGGTAGAAAPRSQSVGRFLDGSAGGMALQSLVDLKDARAKAAPNTKQRQGVNAELFDAADIPIGNGLKLPGGGVFNLGAANQIAVAKTDGYSYGASGAVENNGGVQLTDHNGKYPADATINLSGAALGKVSIPGLPTGSVPGLGSIPGLPSLSSLGGVTAKLGAVQALAQTGTDGKTVKPQSSLADVQLSLGSPALGSLLTQLKSTFDDQVLKQLEAVPGVGTLLNTLTSGDCALVAPEVKPISADGVTINVNKATITVDAGALLKQLTGIDIAHLNTSNFDLIKFVVQNLPKILSKGLTSVVTTLADSLKAQFLDCAKGIKAIPAVGTTLYQTLQSLLNTLQTGLVQGLNTIADPLISAGSGGLATLADGLTGAVDIGLNVQSGPKIQPHNTKYKYSTQLKKTPDQATAVVHHQSLVRAVEIDLADASGQATGGGAAVSLALGNAAAGPSVAAPATPTTTPPTTVTPTGNTPTTSLPTGVPAGAAGSSSGSSPLIPAALVLLGLVIAGGGVFSFRMRGKFGR
ncbi:choice-of-anchor G family protein [Jatrophihabitans endophyticus]|uniref:choice-of-anchor G family protein n=1 Tax=Jatrophihabitans endophyticus TaxID=1206085 RepID=UPI0019D9FB77|nr:choice-of-anchor G family protein [Jatrophihabitans endophyticus]MBE7189374.1 choice-of-anchor G family protein [Jatrophihabitans endophyticus]